jgi:hypothetical protein
MKPICPTLSEHGKHVTVSASGTGHARVAELVWQLREIIQVTYRQF